MPTPNPHFPAAAALLHPPTLAACRRLGHIASWMRAACVLVLALASVGCADAAPDPTAPIPDRSTGVAVPARAAVADATPVYTADAPTSRALALLRRKDLPSDTRLRWLVTLADQNPKNPGVREVVAQAFEDEGRIDDAIRLYRETTELDPSRAYAWLRHGVLLKRDLRDLKQAEKSLRTALEKGAPRSQALNELGAALAQQKKFADALAVWDTAIQEDPGWGTLYANALKASLSLDDEQRALGYYNAGRAAVHQPPEVLFLHWGEYLGNKERYDEAIGVYRDATAKFPKSAELSCYLAQNLRIAGKTEEARGEYQRALTLDPEGAKGRLSTWARRGLFLIEHPEDEATFQKAVQLYFGSLRDGKQPGDDVYEEVSELLGPILEKHPEFWNAWLVQAWALRRSNKPAEAEAAIAKVLEIYPGEPNAWVEKGLIARTKGDYKTAYEHLQKARKLAPRDPTIWMNLAATEIDLGKFEDAAVRIKSIEGRMGSPAADALRDYMKDRRKRETPPGKDEPLLEFPTNAQP